MLDENNSPIQPSKKVKFSPKHKLQKQRNVPEIVDDGSVSKAKTGFSDEVLIPESPTKTEITKVAVRLFADDKKRSKYDVRSHTSKESDEIQEPKQAEKLPAHSSRNMTYPALLSPSKQRKPLQTFKSSPKSPQKKKTMQETMVQKALIFSPQSKNKTFKGLRNIGSSCYINSVLECLLNAEPFCKDITCDWVTNAIKKATQERIPNSTNSKDDESLDVLLAFVTLVIAYRNDDRDVLVPKELKESVCKHFDQFSSGQQDAHEFLMCFLDLLNTQLETVIELIHSEQPQRYLSTKLISPVKKNFQFDLNRIFQCKTCSRIFTINELVTALSLSFGDSAVSKKASLYSYFSNTGSPAAPCACSVQDIVKNFFTESTAECKCAACGKNQLHASSYTIKSLPRFLLLHLKRFYLNTETHQLDKRDDTIRLDDIIDLSKFVSHDTTDPEPFDHNFNIYPTFKSTETQDTAEVHTPAIAKRGMYRLQSVVCHVGSLQLGHYTAYVRVRPRGATTSCHCDGGGGWRHYDDSLLVDVKETPKTNAIYLLVYALEEHDRTQ